MSPERLSWLRWWWPVLAGAALSVFFSTDVFSPEHTSRFFIPILRWLLPGATLKTLTFLHHVIRKCAHLAEYFVFGLLLLRGVRAGRAGWRLEWAIWAIAIATGWAALDELHQAFVPSRGPSMRDVLIDMCGAAAGQIAWWVVAHFRGRTHAAAESA